MWAKGAKEEALKFLRTFCISLSRDIGFEQPDRRVNIEKAFIDDARHLLARSSIKQGQWRQELSTMWTPVRFCPPKTIYSSYFLSGDHRECYMLPQNGHRVRTSMV
jgi:hypothetical protein